MKPPWKEYPNYEPHCLGFRMGGGEDYMDTWFAFWNYMDNEMREEFKQSNPAPKGWEYCYGY